MGITTTIATVMGTVLTAVGQVAQGNAAAAVGKSQQQAADYKAQQETAQAGQEQAAAQAKAGDEVLKAKYAGSTARALAAASGGGATDPTVLNDEAAIEAKGKYNFDSDLYSGNEKAAGLDTQSRLDVYTGQQEALAGQQKQQAAFVNAGATVFGGVGKTLAQRYGDDGGYKSTPLTNSGFGNGQGSWE